MKPFKWCCNCGPGHPVCPPSKVICRECLNKISDTFQKMADNLKEVKDGPEP